MMTSTSAALAVLTGQGRVGIIAVAFLIGAWAVSVPLAFIFVDKLDWALLGIWRALVIGYATITVIAIAAVLRSDWPATVRAAIERSRKRAEAEAADGDDKTSVAAGGRDKIAAETPLFASSAVVAVGAVGTGAAAADDVEAPLLGSPRTKMGVAAAVVADSDSPMRGRGYGTTYAAPSDGSESINRL